MHWPLGSSLSFQWISGSHAIPTHSLVVNLVTLPPSRMQWRCGQLIISPGLFVDPSLVPCNHGLRLRSRPDLSFAQRRAIFFPHEEHELHRRSVWSILWNKGYIQSYHKAIGALPVTATATLHGKLDVLFANVQCLPLSIPCSPRRPGILWTLNSKHTGPTFITNPSYYKLVEIGTARDQPAGTLMHVKAAKGDIAACLDFIHRGIPIRLSKKMDKREKRTRHRRGRKPPPPRTKKKPVIQNESEAEAWPSASSDEGPHYMFRPHTAKVATRPQRMGTRTSRRIAGRGIRDEPDEPGSEDEELESEDEPESEEAGDTYLGDDTETEASE